MVILAILDYRLALAVGTVHTFLRDSPSLFYISRLKCPVPFITTGTFTRDAIKEATRDGAPPIDLIDGEQLVQCLKELGLGVKIVMIESVEVDTDWFTKI